MSGILCRRFREHRATLRRERQQRQAAAAEEGGEEAEEEEEARREIRASAVRSLLRTLCDRLYNTVRM